MKAIDANAMCAAVALFALAGSGCDRTHLSAHFGEANRAAFRAQVIDPDAGSDGKTEPPLDPEEAATIARTHMRSLSAPSAPVTGYGNPVLVVPPGSPGTGMAPLPQEPER